MQERVKRFAFGITEFPKAKRKKAPQLREAFFAGLLFTEVIITYSAATSSAGVAAASAAFASAFCFLCAKKRS